MQNLNQSILLNLVIGLPPLAEQRRIVARVDELMALCDQLAAARAQRETTRDRLAAASLARLNQPDPDPPTFRAHAAFALDNLAALTTRPDQVQALRQTILNLAVRGKLVPQDASDEPAAELLKKIKAEKARLVKSGEIKKEKLTKPISSNEYLFSLPPAWKWVRFNQVAAIQSNLVDPKNYGNLPHIAPDNIEGWTARLLPYVTVNEAGVVSGKHLFYAGSILYSKIRPNLAKVVQVNFDGLCSADMYPIKSFILRDYLLKFMITRAFVDQTINLENRVAMPKINQAGLSNLIVPLPPLAEQRRIVARVDALMALCDRLEASLSESEHTRRRLLDALLHAALAPTEGAAAAA
jgi:type I restriction enzyme S subunit